MGPTFRSLISRLIGPRSIAHARTEGGDGGEGAGAGVAPAGNGPPPEPPKTGTTGEPNATELLAQVRAVTRERDDLKKAEDDRQSKALADKGEHEKIAANERTKREAAEGKLASLGRRLAFQVVAVGKVADMAAALKLAQADGLLDGIKVDDDGNAEDPKAVEEALREVLRRYAFLKPGVNGARNFGGDAGGNDPAPPRDPSTMSASEKIKAGLRSR